MQIKLENLTKIFTDKQGRETTAVDKLNLTIEDGKLIGLLGPSGCGKSTTLFMIAGLHEPSSGRIYFGDDDVTDLTPDKRGIGLVFQNYALYPHMTIRQNIMFPLENLKVKKEDAEERIEEVAKLVGISNLLERKPSQLSGGQQQRVAIARALVKTPKVLLLDEPLSNLDARLRLQMREEIKRIQRKTGITAVFVTHDQEEAMSICDSIVLMEAGIEQQRGIPQKIYDEPKNLFVAKFLGTPPINLYYADIKNKKVFIGDEEVLDATDAKIDLKKWDDLKANHPICAEDNSDVVINVVGSSQYKEVITPLLDEFKKYAGGFNYEFNLKGSQEGFTHVQGRFRQKPKKHKKAKDGMKEEYIDKRPHLGILSREFNINIEHPIYRFTRRFLANAIVPIVNKNNLINNLTQKEIKSIFSKKFKKWSRLLPDYTKELEQKYSEELLNNKEAQKPAELIWAHKAVTTLVQNAKSGVRELAFMKLGVSRYTEGWKKFIPVLFEKKVKSDDEVVSIVSERDDAIGFIPYKLFKTLDLDSLNIKEVSIDDLKVSDENILDGSYFFSTISRLVANQYPQEKADKLVVAFLDFVKTFEGDKITRELSSLCPVKKYLVGIRPEGYEINEKGKLTVGYDYYESIGRDLSLVAKHNKAKSKTFRIIINDTKDANKLKDNKVRLNIKPDKVYVFDEETGERVL